MMWWIIALFCFCRFNVVNPELLPGDQIPGDYVIPTLDGKYTLWERESHLIVQAYDPEDAFSRYMWRSQTSLDSILQASPPSVSYLFLSHSGNTRQQAEEMKTRLLGPTTAAAREYTEGRTRALLDASIKLHFATDSTAELTGWLPRLLKQWPTPRKLMHASITDSRFTGTHGNGEFNSREEESWNVTRLYAAYFWINWTVTGIRGTLVEVYAPSNELCASNPLLLNTDRLNGSIALIPLPRFPNRPPSFLGHQHQQQQHQSTRARRRINEAVSSPQIVHKDETEGPLPCVGMSYADILKAVQQAGAIAALFTAPEGSDIDQVHCYSDEECSSVISIPVSMVSNEAGQQLNEALKAGKTVTVNFTEIEGLGFNFGIDKQGRLFEIGWLKFPTLHHAVWAAQWQSYLDTLHTTIQSSVLNVSIFTDGVMEGVRVNVTLPALHTMQTYHQALLDMELNCMGPKDQDCPVWDHMIQFFVCCTAPGASLPSTCDVCPTTVWSPNPLDTNYNTNTPNKPEEKVPKYLVKNNVVWNNVSNEGRVLCGRELGRWATPFRRRGGRWLTDITALLPLLSGGPQCTFTMQSTPWAGTWVPSLSIRLLNNNTSVKSVVQQRYRDMNLVHKVVPLPFSGGTFDAGYNKQHPPFNFSTPPHLNQALLVSYITGHGSDEWGCAEFCPTSHTFEINNWQYTTSFDVAGTPWGCADLVTQGVLPNEHGTWQYGRNGWCDGQAVHPWVIDITSDLVVRLNEGREAEGLPVGGEILKQEKNMNVIRYKGLFQGKDPDPKEAAGEIMMQSTLILYYYQTPFDREV